MPAPYSSPPPPLAPSAKQPRRVAIIGGGITGLAAANRLRELEPSARVTLFEASGRLGGALQTEKRDGYLIERSADMFTTREPWALDLCRRLGIDGELIDTDKRFRRAFVVRRGRLIPVPEGFTLMSPTRVWPIVKTPILSPLGKLRLAAEYLVPRRREDADESLESFVVRRFGREAFERLIQPLIGGIYTADPSKLSMQATLPQFVEMERKYGSIARGLRRPKTEVGWDQPARAQAHQSADAGVRYGQFVAPRDGMGRLVEAIAKRLSSEGVRLDTKVERIERYDEGWRLISPAGVETFDDLIVCTPGAVSSRLAKDVDRDLSDLIGRIEYAGCSVAIVGVRRDQIAHPLDGFGFVVPAIERRKIIACSFASVKFPGRAPEGRVLLRAFVGGALQPELTDLADDRMRQLVLSELRELIGLSGEPELFDVARWPGMMPQSHVGHLDLVAKIEERVAAIDHFASAGNAYRGVGIPQCIRSGEQAAERIVAITKAGK